MTRIVAIAALFVIAILLFRYRTNRKLQKGVVIVGVSGFLFYIVSIMIAELLR